MYVETESFSSLSTKQQWCSHLPPISQTIKRRQARHAVLKKSLKQYLKKQQLYSHLPPILQIFQIRWVGHAWHCWRSKNPFTSNIFLWIPIHRHTIVGWPTKTYIHQLSVDTGCCQDHLQRVMANWFRWWESWGINAVSTFWWWWWWCWFHNRFNRT